MTFEEAFDKLNRMDFEEVAQEMKAHYIFLRET